MDKHISLLLTLLGETSVLTNLQTWFLVTMITTELSVLLDGTHQALRKLLAA